MGFPLYAFDYPHDVILAIVDTFVLHEFILKVIILIIMAGCCVYTTLLLFTTHPGSIIIFIIIKVLSDFAFFMK